MQILTNNFMKENQFSIASENELIQSFRPKDQKKLLLPENLQFPMNVRSYFTWKEPSGVYRCHAYGSSEEIGMLSVAMSSTVSTSYFVCQDLRCIEKIEEASVLSGKNPEKYIVELYHRMDKLFENISNYRAD